MGFRVAIDGLRNAEPPASADDQKPDLTGVEIVTHPVAGNIYMLEATGDVAGNIATSVGPDGILIVDDYGAFEPCRRAVHAYRDQHHIHEEIITVDWTGVCWRRDR